MAEVELRAPISDPSCFTECATGLVSSVLTNAVDDMGIELDYFSDNECPDSPTSVVSAKKLFHVYEADLVLNSGEPTITEETEETMQIQDSTAQQLFACESDSEEYDDCDSCDFNSDVCSMASENPDGSEHIDDMLVAGRFAKTAVSDSMIMETFFSEEASSDDDGEFVELKGVDCDASSDEEEEHVEVLGEAPYFGDDFAFDYTSNILGGAFRRAAMSWKGQDEEELASLSTPSEVVLKETAEQAFDVMPRIGRTGFIDVADKSQEDMEIDALKQKARDMLLEAAQAEAACQKLEMSQLKSQVQRTLVNAVKSGKLEGALSKVMRKTETPAVIEQSASELSLKLKLRQTFSKGLPSGQLSRFFAAALQKDKWGDLQKRMQTSLKEGLLSGKFQHALQEVMAPVAVSVPQSISTPQRAMTPSRSRRRIIGGVVRTPPMQPDQLRKHRKSSKATPVAFSMDLGMESAGEESSLARASSLTRSYDTLGAQLYDLASPKLSKTRSRLQDASMSAMSMDLQEELGSTSSSRPASRQSLTPMALNLGKKMHPSRSLGSLTPFKAKEAPGGLLPFLAFEKTSAEAIAWTLRVSKTSSKWSNTGLRGSASMIF